MIEISQEPGTLVLRIRGELDLESSKKIEAAVLSGIAGACTVELDLRGLTFCDSSGIAMFLEVDEQARRAGTELFLSNLLPGVARVLQVTGVDEVLTIVA